MRTVLLFILFISSLASAFEGPDYMLYGETYVANKNAINLYSFSENDGSDIQATFQHASLYGINSLDWNFTLAKYSNSYWSVTGIFRDYGIANIYAAPTYSLNVSHLFFDRAALGIGFERAERTYGDNLYSDSDNALSLNSGITLTGLNFNLIIDQIQLNHKKYYAYNPEIVASACWYADNALTIFGLFYRNKSSHDRFLIGQNLRLNEILTINAGLLSGPEVYYAGFEIVYKRFAIGYTLYDISALPNCSKFYLTYR